ncbi:MAG: prepilin peptidase [Oscillospiraceae bacterium]
MNFSFLFLYFLVFYYGACLSSFINAYAYRYANGLKITKGRSFCENCGATLEVIDLIPVFSYIFLGGKCRRCKKKISPIYLISEVVGGALCVICFLRYGFTLTSILSALTALCLFCVSLVDWKTMEIPHSVQLILALFSLLSLWVFPVDLKTKIIGFFAVSAPLILINFLVAEAFGGGDIKLMAICGFMLGWKNIILAMFIGLVFGGGYGIYLMATKKSKAERHMPFGPFLAVGIYTAMLWGEEIISFYLKISLV